MHNTLCITQECSRIPREGLWTNSSRFLLNKSWGVALALLVEYECEQTIPKHITIKHNVYQARIDMNNKCMQDIKQVRDRESNHKHGRFVSRFEHPCSTSPPSTLEGFPLKIDPTGSLGAATPTREVHTRTPLDSLVPSLVPARTTHRKHASLLRPHLYTEFTQEPETTWTRKSASSKYKKGFLVI